MGEGSLLFDEALQQHFKRTKWPLLKLMHAARGHRHKEVLFQPKKIASAMGMIDEQVIKDLGRIASEGSYCYNNY